MRDTLPPPLTWDRKKKPERYNTCRQADSKADRIHNWGTWGGIVGKIHPQPTCKNTVESSSKLWNQSTPLSVLYSSAYRNTTHESTKIKHKFWHSQHLEHISCTRVTPSRVTHTHIRVTRVTRITCVQGASVSHTREIHACKFNLPVKLLIIKNISKMSQINKK